MPIGSSLDLTNCRFGRLTVLSKLKRRASGGDIRWKCQCSCGCIAKRTASDLRRANPNTGCRHCGNIKPRSATCPPKISGTQWIPLTRGKFAIVDETDHALVARFNWRALKDGNTWYAATGGSRQSPFLFMHRLIAGLEHSMVDHKDGDGLNNRRHNLRGCTRRDNSANSRKRQHTSSRFKGVSYNSGKWLATIGYDRKTHYLGRYDTEEDAAMAYDRAALRHFGTFAKVNFK